MKVEQLIHGHHVVIEIRHDHHRAKYDEGRNEHSKGQSEEVVRMVRCARDVKKERDMHAHLCNRQCREEHRHRGPKVVESLTVPPKSYKSYVPEGGGDQVKLIHFDGKTPGAAIDVVVIVPRSRMLPHPALAPM